MKKWDVFDSGLMLVFGMGIVAKIHGQDASLVFSWFGLALTAALHIPEHI